MSTNAASLRRILRSIGSHATPSTTTSSSSTNFHPPNTRAASQLLGPAVQCDNAPRPRRQPGSSRQYQGVRPLAQTEANHRQAAPDSAASEQPDGKRGDHAGAGRLHVSSPRAAVGESEEGKAAADEKKARRSPARGKDPVLPVRRLHVSDEKATKLDKKHQDNIRATNESQQRYRAGLRVKKEGEFSGRYFQALEETKKAGMRQRARRRQLMKKRHTTDDEKLWPDIMRLLEQDSPRGAKHYTKRTETIRLPEGILAKWAGDPGESILEVMQRTGSHVQVVPSKELGMFSSLTLLGKPTQNNAAKRLLQESNLLQAVSEDDLNASKSLADYQLRSEISDRYGEATGEVDDVDEHGVQLEQEPDELDMSKLKTAVGDTIGRAPTRAVWSMGPTNHRFAALEELLADDCNARTLPPGSFVYTSAVSLTARIEEITAEVPPSKPNMGETQRHSTYLVRDELVALLTNPRHITVITPVALAAAMNYLAQHMHFPSIRGVLDAIKDTKLNISADIFNPLLAVAAQSENVLAFHYVVQAMRERSVTPDADTWVQFHTLMLKRFPEESSKVIAKMKTKAVEANLSARIDNLESYSAILLESYMAAYPDSSINDYLKLMNGDMPNLNWLTSFTTNVLCNSLLKKGKTIQAFEVVDELVRKGGGPDTVTLNSFLSSAKREGNMEMAVAILRKFHDLHTRSLALAETDEYGKPTMLPRRQDLSIKLNQVSFKLLHDIAWDRKQFNCLRVLWRYACCAGCVPKPMRLKILESATSSGALASKFDAEKIIENKEKTGGSRGRLWQAFGAKFAIGIYSRPHVQKMATDDHTADSLPLDQEATTTSEETPEQSQQAVDKSPSPRPQPKQAQRKKIAKATILADMNESHSLRPTRPLVDLAEEAWLKDKAWKQQTLGLPAGLRAHKFGDAMFEVMLKHGVQVPVEVGDAVGMTV